MLIIHCSFSALIASLSSYITSFRIHSYLGMYEMHLVTFNFCCLHFLINYCIFAGYFINNLLSWCSDLHFLLYTTERNHVLIRSNTLCFNYLNNVNLNKRHSLPCSILRAEKRDNCHFLHSLNNAFSVECLECPLFLILVLWSLFLEHITQSQS